MAALGNVGKSQWHGLDWQARPWWTSSKQPTSVDAWITDAPDGAIIALTTRGVPAGRQRADSTGVHFYDLDDGDYLAYTTYDGTPGLAWSINVTVTVVTITRISTSGIIANWSFA